MVVSLDVVTMGRTAEGRKLLAQAKKLDPPGGRVLGAAANVVAGEEDLYPPWWPPAKNSFIGNFTRRDGWGNMLNFKRVFVPMAWESQEALDAFRATEPWPDHATERWHAQLRPVRVTGNMHGTKPFGEDVLATQGTNELPGIVITWANFSARYTAQFVNRLRPAAEGNHSSPGALASFGAIKPSLIKFVGFTVSLWRTLDEAVAYAYRERQHKEAIEWYREIGGMDAGESFFGRFVVERSEGTIAGRDPFAGIELASRAREETVAV